MPIQSPFPVRELNNSGKVTRIPIDVVNREGYKAIIAATPNNSRPIPQSGAWTVAEDIPLN